MIRRRRLFREALVGLAVITGVLVPVATANAATVPAGQAVNLTTSNDGSAITVHVGDTINVHLVPDGQWRWSVPDSSDDSVLHRVATRAHNGHHHKVTAARTSFRAVGSGSATLEAIGSFHCDKGRICPAVAGSPTPILARLWRVDVIVE